MQCPPQYRYDLNESLVNSAVEEFIIKLANPMIKINNTKELSYSEKNTLFLAIKLDFCNHFRDLKYHCNNYLNYIVINYYILYGKEISSNCAKTSANAAFKLLEDSMKQCYPDKVEDDYKIIHKLLVGPVKFTFYEEISRFYTGGIWNNGFKNINEMLRGCLEIRRRVANETSFAPLST